MRIHIQPSDVARAFSEVADCPAFRESAALVAKGGMPVEMLQAMAMSPGLLRAFGAWSEAVYPGGSVERRVKELVILAVSQRNACQFCTDSHVAIARHMGMVAPDGDPLALLDQPSQLSARERLAVEYARAAHRDSNRVPAELFAALRGAFTDAEIVELTATVGLIQMLNLFNNCLQVAYRSEYGGSA